ncbi:MAG: ABC transporter permease [Labilithrix sp.]|nr:ABC transporter permease [Labilithrix sp.]
MKTLLRFGLRELMRAKGRVMLIVLVLTVQVAALGGGFVVEDSLLHTRDHYYDRLHLADLDVRFAPAASGEMPSLETLRAIPGVERVSRRFVGFGHIERDGGLLPVVVHYLDPSDHPEVDDIEMRAGSFLVPGRPDLAIADRSFAEAHALALGDELVVNPHRFASRFKVAGVALSPEYLVPTANPEMLVPHRGSLGILYASREALDRTFTDKLYNNLVFTFRPGADAARVTREIRRALADHHVDVERVVPRRSNFGHRYVDEMLSGSRIVMPTIALLLGLMAGVVAIVSVHRIVVSRRREIGSLLAHGFAPRELVLAFVVLGIIPGVAAAVLGAPAAMLFAAELARTNAAIAGFPPPMMSIAAHKLALASVSAIVVGVVSALVPALGVLRVRPVHALRGGDEIRFTGLWRPLERLLAGSPSVRFAVRNVFRRLRLSAATVALVALAVTMPAGLLTSIASWQTWADAQAARLGWDAIVTFKVPLARGQVDEILAAPGAGDYEGYVQAYATVERPGAVPEEMRVRGLPVPSEMVSLELASGRTFSAEDADEAVFNVAFSRGLPPPALGEIVTVVHRGKRRDLVVVGTVADASLSTLYVPRETAQEIFGLGDKVTGVYMKHGVPRAPRAAFALPPPGPRPDTVEAIDLGEAAPAPASEAPRAPREHVSTKTALLANELVTSVQIKSEFAGATVRYLSAFNAVVVPFVGLGAILAAFFLASVLGFLLLEREGEYATLRTMGYGWREIARSVFVEIACLGVLGLTASLVSWVAMAYVLRAPMAAAWFSVPLDFRAHDFGVVAAPTLAFLLAATIPGARALMRLDLSAVLRGARGSAG